MASPDLTDSLQALSLDPECLPFCPEDRPTESKASLREKLEVEVPRYLFRVYTPNSAGVTDKLWTKSMDARYGHAGCKMDILKRTDDKQVAGMLNRHLRWMEGPSDNLVSWTSSILFALTYIFHLHANERDGSTFEDICLCIVDTSCFPKGVFLRDMDLIDAYRSFDQDLEAFASLRSKKHSSFSGFYYFGEYLSQGALKIANKCEIVAAQKMIAAGLYDLQPKFQELAQTRGRRPPWANLVIELREGFYQKTTGGPGQTGEELKKVVAIAKLFGPRWSLPVAANFIAMLPHQVEERDILEALELLPLTDDERRDSVTRVIACDDLPEVKRFDDIMRSVYLKAVKKCIVEAESQLRHAIHYYDGVEGSASTDLHLTETGLTYDSLPQKLGTISNLALHLRQETVAAVSRGGTRHKSSQGIPLSFGQPISKLPLRCPDSSRPRPEQRVAWPPTPRHPRAPKTSTTTTPVGVP